MREDLKTRQQAEICVKHCQTEGDTMGRSLATLKDSRKGWWKPQGQSEWKLGGDERDQGCFVGRHEEWGYLQAQRKGKILSKAGK